MDELQSALSERGLAVATLAEKGRCLFSTKDFSPGDVIIREEPYVCVPSKSSVSRCDSCFAASKLKKCSACRVVWYCGSSCQSDWKLHRLECQALAKLDKDRLKSLTPTIRLMVKLHLKRKLQNDKIMPSTDTDNCSLVEALVSHMSELSEKQLLLYAQMANLVKLILQWPEAEISVKEIAENFSKLSCNAHTICDSELRPLGTGLYPVISIINHSCLPNSVLVFEGRSAVIRAVQHISKGTEVLISYIELAGSSISRQKLLKEQYFFSCSCTRCSKVGSPDDVQESAILEGYRCKNYACSGFLLRDRENNGFTCQKCGLLRDTEELMSVAGEVKLMSEKASNSLSNGYNAEASVLFKKIEELQMKLCHPFSINLMRTRETLLKVSMELKNWKEALKYCRLTIPVYQRVYSEFHPLLGLQYYTCGKLEWLLGETDEAMKSLSKAVDVLRVTHGANTPFMNDLLSKLGEARAEASFRISSNDSGRHQTFIDEMNTSN